MDMKLCSSSEGETVMHTEDVVQALIDHLVEPLLPARTSSLLDRSPPLGMQLAVAKQMHAVVLLYNYYHRKQFPHLEFLDFENFCKVAIIAKPSILAYMKPKGGCDAESYDPNKQLSITEELILDACNISTWLDASRDGPIMEECPVSKIAVFLTDSAKKNCYLLHSSITQGVWSLIEKNLDDFIKSEGMSGKKNTNKRKRTTKRPLEDEPSADDSGLQQLALSVVKETTGIDQTDLMVLESHVVYSLSEEKTATRVYLMKCTKPVEEDIIAVPIADAINSLKGPLVKKISANCTVSPFVEYFHLLPYAEILADWLSREALPHSLQLLWEGQGSTDTECSPCTEKRNKKEVNENIDRSDGTRQTADVLDNKTSNIINGTVNPKENGECFMSDLPKTLCSSDTLVEGDPAIVCPMIEDKSKATQNLVSVDHVAEKIKPLTGDLSITKTCGKDEENGVLPHSTYVHSPKENGVVERKSCHLLEASHALLTEMKAGKADLVMKPSNNDSTSPKLACEKDLRNIGSSDQDGMLTGCHSDQDGTLTGCHPLVPFWSNSQTPDKTQAIMASKGKELSQAALKVLWRKRDELSSQQRHLQDEIARCEKNLQTILSEDDLILKIECIIEACNDQWSIVDQTHKEKHLHHRQECSPQYTKRKKLSEAILNLRNPCQELDEICSANNWMLPTYNVLPSNGGFNANVTVLGGDFECSGGGDPRADPREARESAAAYMLSKLRSMEIQSQ